jgi:hypothetical protein
METEVNSDERIVEAELIETIHKRNARLMYQRIAVLIALPIAFVALIPSLLGLLLLHREVERRCTDAAINRAAIRASVIDNLRTLGYEYTEDGEVVPSRTPPLAYYRSHPAERAAALAQTKVTLDRFPKINCKIKAP